jgi:uncharacterized protein YceK
MVKFSYMRRWLVLVLFVVVGCSAVAVKESSKRDFPETVIKERLKEIRQ